MMYVQTVAAGFGTWAEYVCVKECYCCKKPVGGLDSYLGRDRHSPRRVRRRSGPHRPCYLSAPREDCCPPCGDIASVAGSGGWHDDFEEALMTRDWEEMLVKTVAMPCPVRKVKDNKPRAAVGLTEDDITNRIAEVAAKLRDEYNKKAKEAFEKGRSEAKAEHKKELLEMQNQVSLLARQKLQR